jgi:hypothetical protein
LKLTDKQQALLMFAAFVLPPLATWMGLGYPTGRAELGLLGSSLMGGAIAAIKELLGGQPQQENNTANEES